MTSTYRRILRERAAHNDAAFAEYVSDLVYPAHLRAFSRFADQHPRAIFLGPRGHAKTTAGIHRAARHIGLARGALRLGILAAVDADAEARSRAVRTLVEHPRFAEVFEWAQAGVEGPRWRDDAWTVRGVDLGKDATCTAMSLGSVRAGPRLDELIADDAVGLQENATAGARAKALETYLSVVEPMLVPGALQLVLGTRWHEEDLYASLIRSGWPSLIRRAIEDGVALWSERYPLEELAERRARMGSPLFNLQYQNDPEGSGGNLFRRAWFQYVDTVPDGVRRAGLDLNASTSDRADYTALVEVVEDAAHNLYIVGAWRERRSDGHRAWLTGRTDSLEYGATPMYGEPTGPRLLWPLELLPAGFAGTRGDGSRPRSLARLLIEATTFQATFVRELVNHTTLSALPIRPDRDKFTRTLGLAARYEASKVFHLRGAPGLEAYEAELIAFPNGAHDDQVDAAVYAADLGALSTSSALLVSGPLLRSLRRGSRARRDPFAGPEPSAPPRRKG
jgi:hypothetical protein